MKKQYIFLVAAMLSIGASAQTTLTFEEGTAGYDAITTYDHWDDSPFNTGVLTPNALVVDNPYKNSDNPTDKCVAYQRSRWASNQYGVRIDLSEPFTLEKTTKYVHALIHKPKEGRVLCIGLGKQKTNSQQGKYQVEQFAATSVQSVGVDEWYDAVFAVRGAGNIDINALVFVTDLETTDALTEDHIAYVDEVVVNTSIAPRVLHGYYPRSFNDTQVSAKSGQKITNIKLVGSKSGEANIVPEQSGTNYMYRNMTTSVVPVVAGEKITPTVSYNAGWMNTFIYIDLDDNGQFDVAEDLSKENPAPKCDLVSYGYIEVVENTSGFNMNGADVSGAARNTLAVPTFTLPADMKPGMYRMRVKIDWGNADPAGRMTDSNSITSNGGQIVDFMLCVQPENGMINQNGLNGDLEDTEGNLLNNYTFKCGEPFTLQQHPAPGFVPGPVTVRYGFGLDDEQYKHDNPQWLEVKFSRHATNEQSQLTIPAKYTIANMTLYSDFMETAKAEEEDAKGKYLETLNFDPEVLMNTTDNRKITALTISGNKEANATISGWSTTPPFPVYADASEQEVRVSAGETLTVKATSVNTTWMYAYVYVDYDHDYAFNLDNELVTKTATGNNYATIPSFTLPADLLPGKYRIRFKTDWSCDDPGGRYGDKWPPTSSSNTNYINDNRGQIIDFTLRVDLPDAITASKFVCGTIAYDLKGRLMNKAKLPAGVYIINGQKVIIK